MFLADAISLSTGALYAVPLGHALYAHSWAPLLGLLGLLGTLGVGEGLKHGVIRGASVRPRGARDCNAWCTNGACEGQPGMPSTHTAFAVFFAVFYLTKGWMGRMVLAVYVVAVAWSRLTKKCHTMGQVAGGAVLGLMMGLLFRWLAARV